MQQHRKLVSTPEGIHTPIDVRAPISEYEKGMLQRVYSGYKAQYGTAEKFDPKKNRFRPLTLDELYEYFQAFKQFAGEESESRTPNLSEFIPFLRRGILLEGRYFAIEYNKGLIEIQNQYQKYPHLREKQGRTDLENAKLDSDRLLFIRNVFGHIARWMGNPDHPAFIAKPETFSTQEMDVFEGLQALNTRSLFRMACRSIHSLSGKFRGTKIDTLPFQTKFKWQVFEFLGGLMTHDGGVDAGLYPGESRPPDAMGIILDIIPTEREKLGHMATLMLEEEMVLDAFLMKIATQEMKPLSDFFDAFPRPHRSQMGKNTKTVKRTAKKTTPSSLKKTFPATEFKLPLLETAQLFFRDMRSLRQLSHVTNNLEKHLIVHAEPDTDDLPQDLLQHRLTKLLSLEYCEPDTPIGKFALLRRIQMIGELLTGKNISYPLRNFFKEVDIQGWIDLRDAVTHIELRGNTELIHTRLQPDALSALIKTDIPHIGHHISSVLARFHDAIEGHASSNPEALIDSLLKLYREVEPETTSTKETHFVPQKPLLEADEIAYIARFTDSKLDLGFVSGERSDTEFENTFRDADSTLKVIFDALETFHGKPLEPLKGILKQFRTKILKDYSEEDKDRVLSRLSGDDVASSFEAAEAFASEVPETHRGEALRIIRKHYLLSCLTKGLPINIPAAIQDELLAQCQTATPEDLKTLFSDWLSGKVPALSAIAQTEIADHLPLRVKPLVKKAEKKYKDLHKANTKAKEKEIAKEAELKRDTEKSGQETVFALKQHILGDKDTLRPIDEQIQDALDTLDTLKHIFLEHLPFIKGGFSQATKDEFGALQDPDCKEKLLEAVFTNPNLRLAAEYLGGKVLQLLESIKSHVDPAHCKGMPYLDKDYDHLRHFRNMVEHEDHILETAKDKVSTYISLRDQLVIPFLFTIILELPHDLLGVRGKITGS